MVQVRDDMWKSGFISGETIEEDAVNRGSSRHWGILFDDNSESDFPVGDRKGERNTNRNAWNTVVQSNGLCAGATASDR